MEKQRITELIAQREQMLRLRNDDSLVKGVTFNTVAGDIRLDNREIALLLIDCLISDIQKQINYLMKE